MNCQAQTLCTIYHSKPGAVVRTVSSILRHFHLIFVQMTVNTAPLYFKTNHCQLYWHNENLISIQVFGCFYSVKTTDPNFCVAGSQSDVWRHTPRLHRDGRHRTGKNTLHFCACCAARAQRGHVTRCCSANLLVFESDLVSPDLLGVSASRRTSSDRGVCLSLSWVRLLITRVNCGWWCIRDMQKFAAFQTHYGAELQVLVPPALSSPYHCCAQRRENVLWDDVVFATTENGIADVLSEVCNTEYRASSNIGLSFSPYQYRVGIWS